MVIGSPSHSAFGGHVTLQHGAKDDLVKVKLFRRGGDDRYAHASPDQSNNRMDIIEVLNELWRYSRRGKQPRNQTVEVLALVG